MSSMDSDLWRQLQVAHARNPVLEADGERMLLSTVCQLGELGPDFAEDVASLNESGPFMTRFGEASEPIRCECCGTQVVAVPESAYVQPRRWRRAIWETGMHRKHTLRRCNHLRAGGPTGAATPSRAPLPAGD